MTHPANKAPESTEFDVPGFLASLSDAELAGAAQIIADDLARAAHVEPNSEWHEACFAGAVILSGEMNKRGLSLATKH